MRFAETRLAGSYVIELEPKEDERGMFARAFCTREFALQGLATDVAQCNLSFSARRGTLRGMHYQVAPFAEVKMVRCVQGAVYDVIIDIRPWSPTYGQWHGVELTARNRLMYYVPEGFAHGYQTLADGSEVLYMVTQFYSPEHERAIRWNDPAFGVSWPIKNPIVSPRDQSHPDFTVKRREGEERCK